MIRTLSLLCVLVLNALAQCSRIENNLYHYPDQTFLINQTHIECVVLDKPDYFAPAMTGNDGSAAQLSSKTCSAGIPDIFSIYTAMLCRCDSFCNTVLAKQCAAISNVRRCTLIAYVKTSCDESSEDDPLSAI